MYGKNAKIFFIKGKIKEMNHEGSIIPIRMDCEDLEFDNNSFDLIGRLFDK